MGEPMFEIRSRIDQKCKIDTLDGSRETLIPLRVVVLKTNLEFDGLHEIALFLAVGIGKELLDRTPHACH